MNKSVSLGNLRVWSRLNLPRRSESRSRNKGFVSTNFSSDFNSSTRSLKYTLTLNWLGAKDTCNVVQEPICPDISRSAINLKNMFINIYSFFRVLTETKMHEKILT